MCLKLRRQEVLPLAHGISVCHDGKELVLGSILCYGDMLQLFFFIVPARMQRVDLV